MDRIEILMAVARGYMLMAQLMKKEGYIDSMKSYAKAGKKCCKMAIELQTEWDKDETILYLNVA